MAHMTVRAILTHVRPGVASTSRSTAYFAEQPLFNDHSALHTHTYASGLCMPHNFLNNASLAVMEFLHLSACVVFVLVSLCLLRVIEFGV